MDINSEDITFPSFDGLMLQAFISKPSDGKRHPGILILHEIWGLNEQIRGIARRFAQQGYVAIAPHFFSRYGKSLDEKNIKKAMGPLFAVPREKRSDPETLQKLMIHMTDVEKDVVKLLFVGRQSLEEKIAKDLASSYEFFCGQDSVKRDSVGITGFCMGGGLAFHASTQIPFKASVIFYGANPKPLDFVAKINGPVLGIYAGEDEMVNAGVATITEKMIKYKKTFALKVYAGVQHAFFNETSSLYDKSAAEDAWQMALLFFNSYLKK